MSNQDNQQAAREFAGGFADALAESLTGAAGLPWKVKVLDASEPSSQPGQKIHFRLAIEGIFHGELFLEFYEPQVNQLASKICGHAVHAFSNEDGDALGKVISSAMSRFSTSTFAEVGKLNFKVERVTSPALGEMSVVSLAADGGDQSGMPLTFYFDNKLLESLTSGPAPKDPLEAEKARVDPVNLNLVLDVELNMSLRFGQRQLPLREVLELSSGSVVELDRQVDDPVELLLDGKVIARGEAVIVDGNYGLRITEITEPIASNFAR
ncbi:MAG: flagellar motor switch protein FliN [Terracidiphilus sp.]|jgi:flagellar motor switch protein FliN/FliY